LEGRLILPKKKELNMSIDPISLLNNLCSSANGAGDGNGPSAFRNALKSLLMPSPGNLPASLYTPQTGTPKFISTFHQPSMFTGGDDNLTSEESKIQSLVNQLEATADADLAAANSPAPTPPPADGSGQTPVAADTSPANPTPPDTSNWTPAQFQDALQKGTAIGNPPDNLTLPPGTTAADVANLNGGLINNLNKLHIQNGTPAGDAAAQKYGYKDMKTLLADKSPQAAAAAGKILWAARASNNVPKADGSPRPAQEQSANTLSAVSSKHEASDGGTGGIFQQWLQGQNTIQAQTTKATSRTYEDGGGKSNATIIGNKIAGAFKKVFSFICPPLADVIQMAQDGATKARDKSVGDKDAAAHDSAALKQDGKNFGKDFAEFAVNFIPGVGEVGMAAKGVEDVAKGAEDIAKGAEDAGKGAKGAADTGAKDVGDTGAKDLSQAPGISSLKDSLQNLIFGDNFKSKLTDLPEDATPQEIKDHVKQKLEDHLNDLLQQLNPPQSGNPNAAQNNQEQLLEALLQILTLLESSGSNPPGSDPGSSPSGWRPGGPIGPVTPKDPVNEMVETV
jgi:hypothetical protein